MIIKQNIQIDGLHGKPILLDVYFEETGEKKPVVVFCHGFKGFKDWGIFSLAGMEMARHGFVFVKFNFSHNGTTVEKPQDFEDLEAFSENTFSIELDDLNSVIDWVCKDITFVPANEKNLDQICLMGHSRGGGIAILQSFHDARVKKLVTWASVNVFGRFWDEETMEKWKKEGEMIVKNGRTGQDMPMKYKMYEDYFSNLDRLHIPTAVKKLRKPFLIIHGSNDEAVSPEMAKEMKDWKPDSELKIIQDQGHTFGAKHPWDKDELPAGSKEIVQLSIDFLKGKI